MLRSVPFAIALAALSACGNDAILVRSGGALVPQRFAVKVEHSRGTVERLEFEAATSNEVLLDRAYRLDVGKFGLAPRTYWLWVERTSGDATHILAAYETVSTKGLPRPRFERPQLWMQAVGMNRYQGLQGYRGFLELSGYGVQPEGTDNGYYLFTAGDTDQSNAGVYACSIHSLDHPEQAMRSAQMGLPSPGSSSTLGNTTSTSGARRA